MEEREPEIWAGVPGYEKYYEVSSWGRIRSLRPGKGLLTPDVNNHKYLRIDMSIDGQRVRKMIHNLVATIWVENPNGYTEVDHDDENRSNNYYKNLKWVTRQENMTKRWSKFHDVEF